MRNNASTSVEYYQHKPINNINNVTISQIKCSKCTHKWIILDHGPQRLCLLLSFIMPTSAYLSSFPIVTNHDVGVLIKNMKPKACVLDPIPAYMFKEYVLQIAPPIRAIINTSLFTGTVPNKLKESVITPIYKRKQLPKDELSSYRPAIGQ